MTEGKPFCLVKPRQDKNTEVSIICLKSECVLCSLPFKDEALLNSRCFFKYLIRRFKGTAHTRRLSTGADGLEHSLFSL